MLGCGYYAIADAGVTYVCDNPSRAFGLEEALDDLNTEVAIWARVSIRLCIGILVL